jgi:hypothetical protein
MAVGAVFSVLAATQGALAQTVAQTASAWGLIGIWRLDCSKPLSRDNPDLAYRVRGGKLFHDRDFVGSKDSSPVITATKKADGGLELVVEFTSLGETRQFAFVKGSDGRIRAVSNRNVNTNEYSIRDGKFTSNGRTTPWQTRCRG